MLSMRARVALTAENKAFSFWNHDVFVLYLIGYDCCLYIEDYNL
jgi:hypothetical protein